MSILKVSIRQVKAARAMLAWSQLDLAAASGLSLPTVKRLESDDGPIGGRPETIAAIQIAFEAAGIEFTNGGQPGVRLSSKPSAKGGAIDASEPGMERRPSESSGKKSSGAHDGNLTRGARVAMVGKKPVK